MATTVSTIQTALATLVAGIPVTDHGSSKTALTEASRWRDEENRPEFDKDREFWIGDIPPGKTPYIGNAATTLIETSVAIHIGHKRKVGGKYSLGRARRDQDAEEITRYLENPSNYPSDVCLVDLLGASFSDSETHWMTKLEFAVTYEGSR